MPLVCIPAFCYFLPEKRHLTRGLQAIDRDAIEYPPATSQDQPEVRHDRYEGENFFEPGSSTAGHKSG